MKAFKEHNTYLSFKIKNDLFFTAGIIKHFSTDSKHSPFLRHFISPYKYVNKL